MARPVLQGLLPPLPGDGPTVADTETEVQILDEGPEPGDYVEDDETGDYIRVEPEKEIERDHDFGQNLVGYFDDEVLDKTVTDLLREIDVDKQSRAKRDKQYEEGIRRTGLGDDAPGGANFFGASKVVHPMLAEGAVDFAARVIREIWPPSGPAKAHIPGTETKAKREKAERKTKFFNYMARFKIKEFRAELEQVLTQVPLGGSQYVKLWWDKRLKRPRVEAIMIDNVYLPYFGSDFRSSYRKTIVVPLSEQEYGERVKSGWYIDDESIRPTETPDQSAAEKATDKVEGKEEESENIDGTRKLLEVYVELAVEDDPITNGEVAPYIITINQEANKIVGWYRNWDENDTTREELQWIVEWTFMRWRGAYGIGLVHLIGGLSAATTGALRALLDSAHINTAATMLMLKGSRISGQNQQVEVTEITEIEAAPGVNDIRSVAMPMPFNPPSPVLVDLFVKLQDIAKGVVRTSMDDVGADMSPNVPVGTQMSRVEQGLIVYSSIFSRMHESMHQCFMVLNRLFKDNWDEDYQIEELGEEIVTEADFEGPMDVIPVSDPALFSEMQRQAQISALVQRADAKPQLYNGLMVEKTLLKSLKIQNPEELLVSDPDPEELDPVSENVHASLGKPIKVYPHQDHEAHLQVHAAYLMKIANNSLMAMPALPALLQHIKEHVVWWYASKMAELAPVVNREELNSQQLAIAQSEASKEIPEDLGAQLNQLMPVIEQAQQLVKQMQPPQPMDPSAASLQAKQLDVQIKDKELAARSQAEQVKAQTEQAKIQAEMQREIQRLASEMERVMLQVEGRKQDTAMRTEAQLQVNREDNETALTIAGARMAESIATGKTPNAGGITTGTSVTNPSP